MNRVSPKTRGSLLDLYDRGFLLFARNVTRIAIVATVLVSVIALTAVVLHRTPPTVDQLKTQYYEALTASNYRRANSAIGSLLAQEPSNLDFKFDKAMLEDKLGDKRQANRMFEELSYQGHRRASVWLLNNLFEKADFQALTPELSRKFNELMVLAKDSDFPADKVVVARLAANFYMGTKQTELAIPYLETLVDESPSTHLLLAKAHESLGQQAAANKHFRLAADYMTEELNVNTSDIELRKQLITTLIALNDENTAVIAAAKGFRLTHDPVFQKIGAEALLKRFNRLKASDPQKSLHERILLIHRASQCDPTSADVIQALKGLLIECTKEGTDQQLERALASGKDDAEALHFTLGMLSMLRLKFDEAVQHLELAEKNRSVVTPVLCALLINYSKDGVSQRNRVYSLLERLHKLSPDNDVIRQAYQQLSDATLTRQRIK